MIHPEVMALRVGVDDLRCADLFDLVEQCRIVEGRLPEIRPVVPSAARDDVVDGCGGVPLMVQMSVQHATLAVAVSDCIFYFYRERYNGIADDRRRRRHYFMSM